MLLLRNVKYFSLLCNVGQSERIKYIGSENDTGETIAFRAADIVDRTFKVCHPRCVCN